MRNQFLRRRPQRKPKETLYKETKKAVNSLIIMMTGLIVVLGVIFLVILNNSSQKGYSLEQKKLENEKLKDLNTDLTTKITNATSSHKIKKNDVIDNMDPVEEKNFVTKEDNAVK